ncbi:hypothetical protein NVW17_000905 [Salmonella enterica]|nr:hypothetical protein [Salmonella enterica]ECG5417779.1 hypothetical protein [Salmonella enterica subsp. enterica serovar Abaetetuba]EBO3907271.1 hypothetical protein [Salmonella enterica]ECH7297231.1 hypothetical protein [Salmonella enterica]ECO2540412.1 hypothetical protein [Salmonella enterica]
MGWMTVLGAIVTALIGLWTFYKHQRAERQMKNYDKTLEYYEALSCQLFSCMDSLCSKEKLKEDKESYEMLKCGAGRAILVSTPEIRDLITQLLQRIINDDLQEKDNECHQIVTNIVRLMNEHLHILTEEKN